MTMQYPYAASVDIIRAAQKDTYYQSSLYQGLSAALQPICGARVTASRRDEVRLASDVVYLTLTTWLGNRTPGEEYCDLLQVESRSQRLPSLVRRSAYILFALVLPYGFAKAWPRLLHRLQRQAASASSSKRISNDQTSPTDEPLHLQRHGQGLTFLHRVAEQISPDVIRACCLAAFYLGGAYDSWSKRLLGLRYIVTVRPSDTEPQQGYEVLGALLLLQMTVQGYTALKNSVLNPSALESSGLDSPRDVIREDQTSTSTGRLALTSTGVMDWLQGRQARRCTLCLEPLSDPSVGTCGHVFCWPCIMDWLQEKAQCPLCRQQLLAQHVLRLSA